MGEESCRALGDRRPETTAPARRVNLRRRRRWVRVWEERGYTGMGRDSGRLATQEFLKLLQLTSCLLDETSETVIFTA